MKTKLEATSFMNTKMTRFKIIIAMLALVTITAKAQITFVSFNSRLYIHDITPVKGFRNEEYYQESVKAYGSNFIAVFIGDSNTMKNERYMVMYPTGHLYEIDKDYSKDSFETTIKKQNQYKLMDKIIEAFINKRKIKSYQLQEFRGEMFITKIDFYGAKK